MNEIDLSKVNEYVEKTVEVEGRVIESRKLGSKLEFILLRNKRNTIQVTVMGSTATKKGDTIKISGTVKKNDSVRNGYKGYEILSSPDLVAVQGFSDVLETAKIENLFAYSDCINHIHSIYSQKGFIEVNSPTIVGSIAEGTVPKFEINFYGEKKYLTVSNILYHQMMIAKGLDAIFEFSKIFRASNSNTSRHLPEIRMLDVHQNYTNLDNIVEETRTIVLDLINKFMPPGDNKSNYLDIPVFSFHELKSYLSKNKIDTTQMNAPNFIRKNEDCKKVLPPLLFITNTPVVEKYFFLDSEGSTNIDFELRSLEYGQILSGGKRITSLDKINANLKNQGIDATNFAPYLENLKRGIPDNFGFSMGLDRFFTLLTRQSNIADSLYVRD